MGYIKLDIYNVYSSIEQPKPSNFEKNGYTLCINFDILPYFTFKKRLENEEFAELYLLEDMKAYIVKVSDLPTNLILE